MKENITNLNTIGLSSKNLPQDINICLHNHATNYLFEHFYSSKRIFSNVLGQMEVDFISIAFINKFGTIFFLSSCPSIEQNLIERKIWQYDDSYSNEFIYQNTAKMWSELYHPNYSKLIHQYKQNELGIVSGISIPYSYMEYNIVFSFGFKNNFNIQSSEQINKLKSIGCFCLREIMDYIPMLDKTKNVKPQKTKLHLIYTKENIEHVIR